MRNFGLKFLLTIAFLVSATFAAFIQSPIPPSTKRNFFWDKDGNGQMDCISIQFLGNLSEEYLKQMVDSLTFDWIDTAGVSVHYNVPKNRIKLDEANFRVLNVDLTSLQNGFLAHTSLGALEYPKFSYGNVNLYLADKTVYPISMGDQMAPFITDARLKSFRGAGTDSLRVHWTEPVTVVEGCESFLEMKSAKDGSVHSLTPSMVHWDPWRKGAVVEFSQNVPLNMHPSTRDSIRFLPQCASDTNGVLVLANSRFYPLTGFYPFEINVPSMVKDISKSAPAAEAIFQLTFQPLEQVVNADTSWEISMDVMGEEFENALRDALNMPENGLINPSKLKISYNVRIYTNLGTYVVGTKAVVKGDDPRFDNKAARLSLKWNFMDASHRQVNSGAYIVSLVAFVEYDGRIVFRSGSNSSSAMKVFGVIRR